MKTDERLLVDARTTWKPYRVAYEIIRALRPLTAGSVVEALSRSDPRLLSDLGIWRRATGNELIRTQVGEDQARC